MTETRNPRIGEAAPDFDGSSTEGELRLSTWQDNSWSLLLGYPAAFTPVSVTEFRELAAHKADFEKLDTKVMAISPDTHFALLAWQRDLRERFDINLEIPLFADNQLRVAKLYGMMHPGASKIAPVRATFILDSKRTVRFLAYYPLANGRSIKELLRVLAALQASDKHQAPTPAEWSPGDKLLAVPPGKAGDLKASTEKGEDFYMRYQSESSS